LNPVFRKIMSVKISAELLGKAAKSVAVVDAQG
jgi:hypothetical protein